MTDEQVTFYFFHMHDFDDNHLLDGIELASAMQHSIEHFIEPSKLAHQSFDSVIMIVDGLLTLDKNNDGFVSYPELRAHKK
uniref:Kazal/vWf domain containing protein n=1 Tax=Rhipicephalus zambeziensis TaxID=60191 RepID=A0A224YB52_9ACAR